MVDIRRFILRLVGLHLTHACKTHLVKPYSKHHSQPRYSIHTAKCNSQQVHVTAQVAHVSYIPLQALLQDKHCSPIYPSIFR